MLQSLYFFLERTLPDDDVERYEEQPGILSRTRWWDPERPIVEVVRAARDREEEINSAHRERLRGSQRKSNGEA